MQTTWVVSAYNAIRHSSNGACHQFGAGIMPDSLTETYGFGALAIHSHTEGNPLHFTIIEEPDIFSVIKKIHLFRFHAFCDQGLKPSPNPVSILDHCAIYV